MKKLCFVLLCVLFSLVACSGEGEQASDQETTENDVEQEEPVEPVKPEEPAYVYPFTGLEAEAEANNRAVAVMVNNHPKARPQTGLSHADVVFEILAEGNITRFMALFHSDLPERVGPVRSARPYYFNLADDYNAMYVYHGAADYIEDMIKSGAVQGLNGMYYDNDKVLFERSNDRVAPHNSYAIFDGIFSRAEEQGYPVEAEYEPLPFAEEVSAEEAASGISFNYGNNSVSYQYDDTSGKYLRYSDGEQTVEYADSTPIELDNVLIMETAHQVIDDAGRREIDLESGGNALLLQQDKVQRVQWERIDGRIIPTKDGEPVPFIPGQTWINVIPTSPGIDGVELSNGTE
ncbi:DUF3048 domain-containing protein [Gracilibacillus caseinilyticus]|uniref:DUF3048 domain-containing protein n=1 Tax=Gracilibacillus caseinilyticus TaxID=2932256 RepID=A0ABY4EYJ5_9BACI|nr:DUF3048 domain-containing protein [Gracilibacillus caseinilyticus]UOQ48972.1 DUF3048 domain-containing protein [Gracilibacillus caseinilyticus]